nr:hypothetical protein [uncultured Ruminococcus sp.]
MAPVKVSVASALCERRQVITRSIICADEIRLAVGLSGNVPLVEMLRTEWFRQEKCV